MRHSFRSVDLAVLATAFCWSGCHSGREAMGARTDGSAGSDATPSASMPLGFACERWGKGDDLRQPSRTLTNLRYRLWDGTDQSADEARARYGDILATGTTGDAYCVALHMMTDARALTGMKAFYAWWLDLGAPFPEKDAARFPGFDSARLNAMAKDTLAFAAEATLSGAGGFDRLFTARRPWIAADGAAVLDGATLSAGLLSDPAVLARVGKKDAPPWLRGWWITQMFGCQFFPPEPRQSEALPDSVQALPVQSFRSLYRGVVGASTCQGCHAVFDPIGLSLDVFDAVGRVQGRDRLGQPFDLSGTLPMLFTGGDAARFSSPAELGKAFAASPNVQACFASRWLTHLTGGGLQLEITQSEQRARLDGLVDHMKGHGNAMAYLVAAAFEEMIRASAFSIQ